MSETLKKTEHKFDVSKFKLTLFFPRKNFKSRCSFHHINAHPQGREFALKTVLLLGFCFFVFVFLRTQKIRRKGGDSFSPTHFALHY
jgi:hypothetical protein